MLTKKYSPLLRSLSATAGLYVLLSALLRVVLWWRFGREAEIGFPLLGAALAAGAINDCVELLYILLPFIAYLTLLPPRWHASALGRGALLVGFTAFCFGLLYLCATEYFFFEEFNARFNLVAVDYLIYPTEVIGNIRDAYPVTTVMCVALIAAVCLCYLLRPALLTSTKIALSFRERSAALGTYLLCVLAAIAGFATHTLARSDNRVANEIAINGMSSFFEAFRTSELDYDTYYRTLDSKQALQLVAQELGAGGQSFRQLQSGSLNHTVAAKSTGLGKLNVVVVVEESFGAEFSGAYGAAQSDTPYFDQLARQGLLFSNTYASGTRTARGLEAITASFPPIPSESILHRPGNENIANWGAVMAQQGYRASFLYGGYGYFDNMNYFYSHNGFQIVDRREIENPVFENIWGVSDEDLFRKTLEHLDDEQQSSQPFFTIIMTTSNHKPFTFREGVPGVQAIGGGRHAGVRYADYALGQFIQDAAKHPWFSNTLFVIVADHGARVYGKTDIPLKTYRIPLLIYSPAHVEAQTVDTLTGQIDIAPTVLGLLGWTYEAPFFGQDVLAPLYANRVALFSHNHDVALLSGNKLVVLGLNKTLSTLEYSPATDEYRSTPEDPRLTALAMAYFQTGSELFKNRRYR